MLQAKKEQIVTEPNQKETGKALVIYKLTLDQNK